MRFERPCALAHADSQRRRMSVTAKDRVNGERLGEAGRARHTPANGVHGPANTVNRLGIIIIKCPPLNAAAERCEGD